MAVEVDRHPSIAKRLRETGVCDLVQDGDHEKTYHFDVADFDTVATIIQPKRRRRITEEQKRSAADRLSRWQFRTSERNIDPRTAVGATT